ncbi:MAG: enoyl-CoA hydratase-related protein [Pseudooceanicola atlanticus]
MAAQVNYSVRARVAVLRVENPPINALSVGTRRKLSAALDRAAADDDVDGVVICGPAGSFAVGIPLKELEAEAKAPRLSELCLQVERMEKPVVALIDGHAAAAGLDLALACHARIATLKARVGLPDLAIGLPPQGGATQRLPRLLGAEATLDLLLDARAMPINSAPLNALCDRVVKGAVALDEAVDFAAELARDHGWQRSCDREDGLSDPVAYQRAIAARQKALGDNTGQLERDIVEAVAAAQLLPFEAGIALEDTMFEEALTAPRSRGLRRARWSENHCNRLTGRTLPGVTRYAVAPATVATSRLTGAILLAGGTVTVIDPNPIKAETMCNDVIRHVRRAVEARNHPPAVADQILKRLTATSSTGALAQAEVIFVDGPDEADATRKRLHSLAPGVGPSAVLLCLTDHLDCGALAPPELRGRVIALSYADRDFPARLAELGIGGDVTESAIATAQAGLWKLGRLLLRSKPGGFMLTQTMGDTILSAADALIRAGLAPAEIDAAMRGHGFRRGAYDLAARQNGPAYLSRSAAASRTEGLSHLLINDRMAARSEGRDTQPLAQLADIARGDGMRDAPDLTRPQDITGAIHAALVNAGCALIADGRAARPMHVDVALLQGWGYPRDTGGPMSEADQMGLFAVLRRCQTLSQLDAGLWTPHPLLVQLQRNGRRFQELDLGGRAKLAA